MAYTFSGSRYITSGVAENFPIELQVALFSAVEQMREKVSGQLDYLQVFEIVTRVKGQKKFLHIYHMQECPEAKLEYFHIDRRGGKRQGVYDRRYGSYYAAVGGGVLS